MSSPTPLVKAKAAFSFEIHSSLQHEQLDVNPQQSGDSEFKKSQAIPALVTQLLVGCRRKVVLYSWKDGEPQEVKVRFYLCVRILSKLSDLRKRRCPIQLE